MQCSAVHATSACVRVELLGGVFEELAYFIGRDVVRVATQLPR